MMQDASHHQRTPGFARHDVATAPAPEDADVQVTPPATLTAAEMATPEEGQTYTHVTQLFRNPYLRRDLQFLL